jgi:hypothetical protein
MTENQLEPNTRKKIFHHKDSLEIEGCEASQISCSNANNPLSISHQSHCCCFLHISFISLLYAHSFTLILSIAFPCPHDINKVTTSSEVGCLTILIIRPVVEEMFLF